MIFIIFMSISEYPWETITFSLDHSQWCPSLPSLVPCSKSTDHTVLHSEYGSAMETLSCPTWDKTWQSYWQTCIPTADTTLLTLDRTGQEYRYTHVQSHANDMTPPALSFPTWDRTGQYSPLDMHMYYWHGCPICPMVSYPCGRGRDSPVDITHEKLGHVWSQL